MKKNNYITLLLALFMAAALVGCSDGAPNGTSDKSSGTTPDQTILQEATGWFKEQTAYYEIISSEVCGDQIVFLTGTKNPGTDDYQNLQAFVVKQADGAYEVTAMKDGEIGVSAGFSAHVLTTDTLTIVFGDTSDSVYDFTNDRRLDVDFTKINILLAQGETRTEEIVGNVPYLLVFDEMLEIADLEFVDAELNIKYSTFYSKNLMNNAASDDISNFFEWDSQERNLSELAFDDLDMNAPVGVGFNLAFENDDFIIFYGTDGLFCYDLSEKEIIFSVDFIKVYGTTGAVQGTAGTDVSVSQDGQSIILVYSDMDTPDAVYDAYYISIPTMTYHCGEYHPMEDAFNTENAVGYVLPGAVYSCTRYIRGDLSWDVFDGYRRSEEN